MRTMNPISRVTLTARVDDHGHPCPWCQEFGQTIDRAIYFHDGAGRPEHSVVSCEECEEHAIDLTLSDEDIDGGVLVEISPE